MLSSDRRRAIRDLLAAALHYDAASRADFIREASHGDPALSDEALRVLGALEAGLADSGVTSPSSSHLIDDILGDSTNAFPPPADRLTSREFEGTARFELRRKLGSGGFGTVYESYDREQRQSVALKVMRRTDPAFLYRFKREFRALVDIRHRNLVELYELFQQGQFWFFTMELVHGVNFLEYVEHGAASTVRTGHAACNVDRLRPTLTQLADAIEALHEARILHRDIKPANVMVAPDGHVRLLDFGLVRELDLTNAQTMMLAGTPAYMSPEQLAQLPFNTASDWYSFGVMTFQALTGSLPPRKASPGGTGALSALLAGLVDVSSDLKRLCIDLLDVDPVKRPTGSEIRARLSASRLPPRAVVADAGPILVGRELQLETLARLLDFARQGRTVIVNLQGRSGVGKSALIGAFRRQLTRTEPDVVVLSGRCHENETVPFKALDALVDDLSRHLASLSPAQAEALTPRDAASLIRVFPVLAQVDAIGRVRRKSKDIVDAGELRQRAFASLQDLFVRLAERKTIVVAIDDLQWGDLDSAAFLRALFSGPSPPSLLFIASYRLEDVDGPFLDAWRSHLDTAEGLTLEDMRLDELSPSESEQLALRLLQPAANLGRAQAESIARESGGSPFLIEQLARHTPPPADGNQSLSLQESIEQRLSELPERSRRLLETIAIAGQPLSESIAYAAAECEFSDRPALYSLVADHFLRVRETAGSREIEIYHDRLREMIVASMSLDQRQQRHLNLAVALEADVSVDPAVLSVHLRGAGALDRASQYAWAAGKQASNALAFERAAEWYQLALDSGQWDRAQATALRKSLAEALVFAGLGTRAAEIYLAAAATADQDNRWEFQRLAAEQLLRAGHVEEGLAVLEGIARELGIWLPSKPWQIILSLVFHRIRALATRSAPTTRAVAEPQPRDLRTLDVYQSFFIGLTMFDPIRAMDFHARHRLLAARVGEPTRLSISLSTEAGSRAASGDHDARRVNRLLERARALCDGVRSPETLGYIATMEVMCACVTGSWRVALHLAEDTDRFLSERCSGVAWEQATNRQLRDAAMFHMGDWRKLRDYAQSSRALVDEAKRRGDAHFLISSISSEMLLFLMSDQPSIAQQFIRDTIALLPRQRFLMPKVWALTLQVYMALYNRDGETAWSLVESQWSDFAGSQFARIEYAAIVALDARARAAILAGATGDRRPLLKHAIKCAGRLERFHVPWATALALLIRAGVASVRGRREPTLQFLERAETAFRSADMFHYALACEYRRGVLIGQETGRALTAAAEAWANSQGIVNPERVFDMLAPGRWQEA